MRPKVRLKGNARLEHLWNEFYTQTEHLYQEGDKENNYFVIPINRKNFDSHCYYGPDTNGKSVISPTVNPYKYCRAIHGNFIKGVLEEETDKYGKRKLKYFVIGCFNNNIGWRNFDKKLHVPNQNENSSYGMVLYEKSYFTTNWEIISFQAKNKPVQKESHNKFKHLHDYQKPTITY